MGDAPRRRQAGFTLLEVSLVVALLLLLSAIVVPEFAGRLKREELPGSARQLRSLLSLVRSNAQFDGKRYRIRFPEEREQDAIGQDRQPIVEREDDPIHRPEEFFLVVAPWAVGETLLGTVWCAEVRLARPSIHEIKLLRESRRETTEKSKDRAFAEFTTDRPPLYVEPDGHSDWAVFVLTEAPRDITLSELEDQPQIHLMAEGTTGLAWMQRPFTDDELDLFEEKNWPAVMRKDFLDKRELTEDDVLELRDWAAPGGARTQAATP